MNNTSPIMLALEIWYKLRDFLEQGGFVLYIIMLVTFFLWLMILERQYYLLRVHQKFCDRLTVYWLRRRDKSSWYAKKVRLRLLSVARMRAQRNLSSIRLVVIVAPLLGLLGTVTGMIDVFDVMATTGANNARAMAAGVSKATIPTMAGMLVSLSGVFFNTLLQRKVALLNTALAGSIETRNEQ